MKEWQLYYRWQWPFVIPRSAPECPIKECSHSSTSGAILRERWTRYLLSPLAARLAACKWNTHAMHATKRLHCLPIPQALARGFPLDPVYESWYRKTSVPALGDGKKRRYRRSLVVTHFQRVTDGWTDSCHLPVSRSGIVQRAKMRGSHALQRQKTESSVN